jgi:flagellin
VSTRRLSSGLRIGAAADDAAGLAVREMMRADIASLGQGVRNANDAISMIQVADGALQVIDEKLIRMKELATQAATGTYTAAQRTIIDDEFQAMKAEIQRIALATDFNKINPLYNTAELYDRYGIQSWRQESSDGFNSPGSVSINAFASANNRLYAAVDNASGAEIWEYDGTTWMLNNEPGFGDPSNQNIYSMEKFNENIYAGVSNTITGCEVWMNNGSNWSQINTDGFGSANNRHIQALKTFNNQLYCGTANPNGFEVWKYDGSTGDQIASSGIDDPSRAVVLSMEVYEDQLFIGANNNSGTKIYSYDGENWSRQNLDGFGNPSNTQTQALQAYNGRLYAGTFNIVTGGEVWEFDGTNWNSIGTTGLGNSNNHYIEDIEIFDGHMYVSTGNSVDGTEIHIYNGQSWNIINDPGFGENENIYTDSLYSFNSRLFAGTANSNGGEVWSLGGPEIEDIVIHFGAGNNANEDYYNIKAIDMRTSIDGLNIETLNVSTQTNAQRALSDIERAIIYKDKIRASLGSIQNRLENTITNLEIQAENLQAAESRISDADMAKEMTEFVKSQILTQSATAMLAQANSLPEMALQLIQK